MDKDTGYFKYTTKSRLDKSINSLLGIMEGISADGIVNKTELQHMALWVEQHQDVANNHPFNEFIPVLIDALKDGKLTKDEIENISWLCERVRSVAFYDTITADLQRLHAIISSIASDGVINVAELKSLSGWLDDHTHLRTCYPYDELGGLILGILEDRRIDELEQLKLLDFFSGFSNVTRQAKFDSPIINPTLPGICAVTPQIIIPEHRFCFTGESSRCTRREFETMILERNGVFLAAVSPRLNYLVVGSNGNPCWAYACYGRKIEQVIALRQKGARTLIVHENDFFDSI